MALDLFKDIVSSINTKTSNVLDDNTDCDKEYLPYIVNKAFSNTLDTIFYANEMNMRPHIPNKQQYDFYYYWIPKGKRFGSWAKKTESEDISSLMEHYQISERVAREYILALSKDDLINIKQKVFKGSVRK